LALIEVVVGVPPPLPLSLSLLQDKVMSAKVANKEIPNSFNVFICKILWFVS
jgi:hypothetical protein